MTRTHRTFPTAFRVLVSACALFAMAWVVPSAAAGPPTHQEVEDAKDRADQLLNEVQAARDELGQIQQRLNAQAVVVEHQAQLLDQVTAKLVDVQRRIDDARTRYDMIVKRLNDRAAQAFIQGPGSNFDFLLGATSLSDLSDRMEFVNVVAESDAELAQQVENVRNELIADESELQDLQAQREQQLQQSQAVRDQIASDVARQQQLLNDIASKYDEAQGLAKRLGKEWSDYQQQLAQQPPSGGHAPVPLPSQYSDILKACPVAQPRFYGDGFGAPRYAGGFHLHAGVDILSNYGTEIYAPFDGTAKTSYNSLGGNAVYVYGSQGYVYNAHVDHYSENSTGSVHAGDVIGYVGDTGDAIGTPHDHFEFHPYFPVPSDWPVSSYGYRVIGTAVNPYPLLVAVCG
jgi:murein DD-endopeptidase MepM/ murein hydrolase activator NlpD